MPFRDFLKSKKRERVLTGIRTTGELHLGNYFGSVQQIKRMQDEYDELYLFIADLHALTNLNEQKHSAQELQEASEHILRAYLAFGIDPKKVTIYRQSDFPQITELFWIFACLLNENNLKIGHAYKDATARKKEVGLGIFLYPALMAADILLPDATLVPVGQDQVQHIEMTREIARKFNLVTKTNYLSEPKELVEESVAVVPGIDGEKMSKSLNNTIPIFASEATIRKQIMAIKTDSTPVGGAINPADCIVCDYLELLLPKKEYATIKAQCFRGAYSYKDLKELLAKTFFSYFAEARKNYATLEKRPKRIAEMLTKNNTFLQSAFDKRLTEIKACLGIQKV